MAFITEKSLILRAEVSAHGRSFVAHTMQLTEKGAFLRTDEPANVGDQLVIRLSFPQLVAPLDLEAHVVSKRLSTGPGDPVGTTVGFVFHTDEERDRLQALLRRTADAPEPAPASAPSPMRPSWAHGDAYRVLVVDDSHLVREMFVCGMKRWFGARHTQVRIDVAEDGQHAWELLHGRAYDLAIVDYYLPVLNGDALVARVRADARLAALPIIAISVGGREAREAFLAAGADLFLDKPVMLRDLCSTLERLTRGWAAA